MKHKIPYAYFLTWSTYGTWLHGTEKGSVDKYTNRFGEPKVTHSGKRHDLCTRQQKSRPNFLNHIQRQTVLNAIISDCKHYQYRLFAAHVRTNHVHAVVAGACAPENILNKLKSNASRALNQLSSSGLKTKTPYWTRHGSTRYIWSDGLLFPVMEYVIERQGSRMALFYEPWYDEAKDEGE